MEVMNFATKCFDVTIVDDEIVENLELVMYGFDGTDPVVEILQSLETESFVISDNDRMLTMIILVYL